MSWRFAMREDRDERILAVGALGWGSVCGFWTKVMGFWALGFWALGLLAMGYGLLWVLGHAVPGVLRFVMGWGKGAGGWGASQPGAGAGDAGAYAVADWLSRAPAAVPEVHASQKFATTRGTRER